MKKLFLMGAVFFGILMTQNAYSDNGDSAPVQTSSCSDQVAQGEGCCPADHPCEDQRTNDCWCKYVHYEPCYYTTKRCVEEKIPCKKKCCRYVPKYYEVKRCRYVPEYYCETLCRKEPEYYYVEDCKTCKKWVCDQHCRYVPKYYWKHVCGDQGCSNPCPTTPCCN